MTRTQVSFELAACSPETIGRTQPNETGLLTGEWREFGSDWALQKYLDQLVLLKAATLRSFGPRVVLSLVVFAMIVVGGWGKIVDTRVVRRTA